MPNPMIGMIGASAGVGLYGAHQQKEATKDAIGAQERASDAAIDESGRQYDQTREDTRIARETGDQAMIALGYLMGVRQPPSGEEIGSMQAELETLQNSLTEMGPPSQPEQQPVISDRAGVGSMMPGTGGAFKGALNKLTLSDRRTIPATPGATSKSAPDDGSRENIQSRIDELTQRIDAAQMERNIAMEMGGGMGKVPDLNTLFEDVNLPSGDNIGSPGSYLPSTDIGSPDAYLPDLDNFLQGLGKDLENSRGYQFELKQGREALQATLSQKGTAYGGNAIKEALMFSQDYASTKYGERHGQALQEFDRAYQSGMTRYGMDIDKYNRAKEEGLTRYGMDIDRYNRDRQGALDQYGLNMDKYRLAKDQEDTQFARLATMSGYGPAGTQVSANAGQNYAQTVANANQNTATTVGQGAYANAGASTQALSNVVNTGMTMYQYNRMMDLMEA